MPASTPPSLTAGQVRRVERLAGLSESGALLIGTLKERDPRHDDLPGATALVL